MRVFTLDTGCRLITYVILNERVPLTNGTYGQRIVVGASCCYYRNGETGENLEDPDLELGFKLALFRARVSPVPLAQGDDTLDRRARIDSLAIERTHWRKTVYFQSAPMSQEVANTFCCQDDTQGDTQDEPQLIPFW